MISSVKSDSAKRLGLLMIAACWAAIAAAYFNYFGNPRVWAPGLVAAAFAGAAVTIVGFVAFPESHTLYELAGGLSVVAIAARAASVAFGAIATSNVDAPWITIGQFSLTIVLFMLLWWFWQVEVKLWHTRRRVVRRKETDGG